MEFKSSRIPELGISLTRDNACSELKKAAEVREHNRELAEMISEVSGSSELELLISTMS